MTDRIDSTQAYDKAQALNAARLEALDSDDPRVVLDLIAEQTKKLRPDVAALLRRATERATRVYVSEGGDSDSVNAISKATRLLSGLPEKTVYRHALRTAAKRQQSGDASGAELVRSIVASHGLVITSEVKDEQIEGAISLYRLRLEYERALAFASRESDLAAYERATAEELKTAISPTARGDWDLPLGKASAFAIVRCAEEDLGQEPSTADAVDAELARIARVSKELGSGPTDYDLSAEIYYLMHGKEADRSVPSNAKNAKGNARGHSELQKFHDHLWSDMREATKAAIARETARRVRLAREHSGFSQSELADKLSVPQPTVSNAERGGMSISHAYLMRVLKACKLPADWVPPVEWPRTPRELEPWESDDFKEWDLADRE